MHRETSYIVGVLSDLECGLEFTEYWGQRRYLQCCLVVHSWLSGSLLATPVDVYTLLGKSGHLLT